MERFFMPWPYEYGTNYRIIAHLRRWRWISPWLWKKELTNKSSWTAGSAWRWCCCSNLPGIEVQDLMDLMGHRVPTLQVCPKMGKWPLTSRYPVDKQGQPVFGDRQTQLYVFLYVQGIKVACFLLQPGIIRDHPVISCLDCYLFIVIS